MKRVLVTGASRGIGKAIAEELVKSGYKVSGTCRNPDTLEDKLPGVTYYSLDLMSESSISECAKAVGSIDILINNAGQSQIGSAEETPVSAYKEMFQVNFFGMAQLTSLLIAHMREQKFGKIINIGSLIASFPVAYYSSYTSTKAATQGYSYSLGMELAPFNIQVSIIEPHDVKTSIKPNFISANISEYAPFTNILRENVEKSMDEAFSADVVAKKVAQVLLKKKMKPFYSIGVKSKLLLFGKRFTSQAFVNKNVYKSFGFPDIQ